MAGWTRASAVANWVRAHALGACIPSIPTTSYSVERAHYLELGWLVTNSVWLILLLGGSVPDLMDAFWWALTSDTEIFTLQDCSHGSTDISSLGLLVLELPLYFQTPHQQIRTFVSALMTVYSHLFFPHKVDDQMYCEFSSLGELPLTTVFQGHSWLWSQCAVIRCLARTCIPCQLNSPVNQA